MNRYKLLALLLTLSALTACYPALNWRELVWPRSDIKAMMPCKPDAGSKTVELAGSTVTLQMAGCEVGDQLFAVSCLDVTTPDQLARTQQAWQRDMLANMLSGQPAVTDVAIKGASTWPAPIRLSSEGVGPRGARLQAQAVWFAKAATLCHAVVYAPRVGKEAAEVFFSGIEIR